MSTTVIHERVLGPVRCPEYGPRARIEVKLKLYQLGNNPRPHFSATCDIYRGHTDIGGGTVRELILKHFPEAAPVVKVHGSDDLGVPTYAYGNGSYWAGFSPYADRSNSYTDYGRRMIEEDEHGIWAPETFAKYLRVTVDEARTIRAETIAILDGHDAPADALQLVCERHDLPVRWQADADAAIAYLKGDTP